jgi:hypothetical protein
MPGKTWSQSFNGLAGIVAVLSCAMAFMLVAPRSGAEDGKQVLPPPEPGQCYPWQDKQADGSCQDPPNLQIINGQPPSTYGLQCWVAEMCLCEMSQSPGAESCAPCSGGTQVTYCR